MGLIAFILIAGPWIAVLTLLWTSRHRFEAARMEIFQRPAAGRVEATAPTASSAVTPIAGPAPIAPSAPIAET